MMFSIRFFRATRRFSSLALCFIMVLTLLACTPGISEAGKSNSSNLPWESPLSALADSLSGPVALAISMIALIIGMGTVYFMGGDLSGWARFITFFIIAAGTIGLATNLLSFLGLTGALIA